MTTVFQAALGTPGTHVFVVGVGAYTHLLGGANPAQDTRGLGQLTSPPVSAKAVVDWFMAPQLNAGAVGFRNSERPLASVEALIAAPQPVHVAAQHGALTLGGATLDEIRDGFNRWRTRLLSQPGSTGIFYFCGHGLRAGVQYALCQDVLRDEGLPWEKAFDVDATLFALSKEAQDCHIHFWIDTCRQVAAEMFLRAGRPWPLRDAEATLPTVERSHSVLWAAGEGRPAFAKENQQSRFTRALLTSLSGFAGSQRYGSPWRVDAAELAAAVRELLRNENKTAERTQYSSFVDAGDGAAIVELQGPPRVKVSLDLAPEHMRVHGEIYIQPCGPGAGAIAVHPCAQGAYVAEVQKGIYNLGVQSPSGGFQSAVLSNEWVSPPIYDHTFEVTP